MSRSLQSSTRPFAGFSVALYFPCPPVPIAFSSFPQRSMWHEESRANWCELVCSVQESSLPPSRRCLGRSPRSSVTRKSSPRVFDVVKTTKALEAFQDCLVHCYIHYGCSDGLFLFTALFVCAFFVRDRTSTTVRGTSRSASRCRTFGVTTQSKLSCVGYWRLGLPYIPLVKTEGYY